MAQTGQRVLLIDADLRNSTLAEVFGVDAGPGLADAAAGHSQLNQTVKSTGIAHLDILPSGEVTDQPTELLNSPAFASMLRDLAGRYDRVLIDSPPLASVTDSRILGALSDATLLVLRAEKSTHQAADQAVEELLGVNANLLGVVLNDVPSGNGRYGRYGQYGYGKKRRGRKAPAAVSGGFKVDALGK